MPSFIPGSTSDSVKDKFKDAAELDIPGPGLGTVNRATLARDSKHLGFTLARYKFVSKMFEGFDNVLEVGCHEGTGSLTVAQVVKNLTAIDFQENVIQWCNSEYKDYFQNLRFVAADAMNSIPKSIDHTGLYDGIFLLDVLEHIDPEQEDEFISNIVNSLNNNGTLIVGIPSLESQKYASEVSKVQHVNCKTQSKLKADMKKYFHSVFMFGMNDEVLHVGFHGMCHYLFALCTNKK